jgi:hypothetical protein
MLIKMGFKKKEEIEPQFKLGLSVYRVQVPNHAALFIADGEIVLLLNFIISNHSVVGEHGSTPAGGEAIPVFNICLLGDMSKLITISPPLLSTPITVKITTPRGYSE